jgi:hypothetical protein
MTSPSSFCTICTKPTAFELVGLLLSLSVYHTNSHMIVYCDDETKDEMNMITPSPRLDIEYHTVLNKYTNYDRSSMEEIGIWSEFQMFKAKAMKKCLEKYPDTMFLDTDIIVTGILSNIDTTKDLGVSPHYMKKSATDQYGYYNGGMLWTKNKHVPDDWIEFTKTSRYYDQASIEDLAKKYSHFHFGENYNIQGWRIYHHPQGSKDFANNFSHNDHNKQAFYKNMPIKCIHTHLRQSTFQQFNQICMHHFFSAKRYKVLAIIYRVLYGNWTLRIPKQPMPGNAYHTNDSFRELVNIMEKKIPDVKIHQDSNTINCWLAPNISLYDRDTLGWVNDEMNKTSFMLIGNGNISEDKPVLQKRFPTLEVHPWMYWGRRPSIIEDMVINKKRLAYEERKHETIFIGNYENAVQKQFRTKYNWSTVIEEFHCTAGSKHKFTHEQYLEKLREAKYGLCLRGYGSKCHREVELMAFGTVPIITPDVCIDSYINPPKENVHFIRIDTPENLKQKLESINKDVWEQMSEACCVWYQENCISINAWNLTIEKILYGDNNKLNTRESLSILLSNRPKHMNISQGNIFMIEKIKSGKPFLISRTGIGAETWITYSMCKNEPINPKFVNVLSNNAGIKCINNDDLKTFTELYSNCIKNCTALATWENNYDKYFTDKYNLPTVPYQILEPFYCIEEGIIPWSHHLSGKKVLVINPFVKSMQEQIKNNFSIYKDKHVFLKDQEYVFYKSYMTLGSNKIHNNWIETFEIMCNDISKIEFDIAILGCGGYGLPLCDFIYSKLNKSAIYIGGGIQLLFGIMGKRWENDDMWKRIIKENNTKFIRPNANEQIKNMNTIENACYW